MPTCPRCALLAVVLAALAFTGCDSNNPGRDLALIEGTYEVEEITFRPSASELNPVDIDDRLNLTETQLRVFGTAGDDALLTIQRLDRPSRRVDLEVSASRGRASFTAQESDAAALDAILLPRQFDLSYDQNSAGRLEGSFSRTVNLQAFDNDRYAGLTSVPGRLTVRLTRR